MRNKLFILTGALFVMLCAATAALADLQITARTTMNGQPLGETTTYLKGSRKRSEQRFGGMQGMSIATIYQCDLRRMLMINDRARKYTVTMLNETGAPVMTENAGAIPGSPAETRRGGIVNYVVTITDTGERQKMFGFEARHLKVSTSVEPGPGACAEKTRYEYDGWYIDLDVNMACDANAGGGVAAASPASGGCQDQIRFKYSGGGGKLGYLLKGTMTFYDASGKQTQTMMTEVTDLKTTPLDASLFDVPAGYTKANSPAELYGAPSGYGAGVGSNPTSDLADESEATGATEAKRPGTIRIGVVSIGNRAGASVSTQALREQLIGTLSDSNLEAVALNAASPAELEQEAKQKQCDFILYTDITVLKQSKAGKVGGLLGRAAGVGSAEASTESRLDFRLVAPGSMSPQLQSSATAKEEGDQASLAAALEQEAEAVKARVQR
jgi:hypothetical protein